MDDAVAFAIAETKQRGLDEVGKDELLLGCLRDIARFGVASLGGWTFDLEELGWTALPDSARSKAKVSYADEVVAKFDTAAAIAKADGAKRIGVEHLLVAFAGDDSGLMGELKKRHGITSAGWRAAIAQLGRKSCVAGANPAAAKSETGRREPGHQDYLSPEQAAEALGIHVQTLRGYVRTGKLPAFRLAGERAIRIRRTDLESVLEPLVPQSFGGTSDT